MSSGGRVQLAATGAQDIFLTANPQMSYFLKQYKRHSRFAMQTMEIPFQQEVDFGKRVKAIVPRIGNLVREIYLKFELPELNQGLITAYDPIVDSNVVVNTYPTFCDSIGHAIIKRADMKIGGQTIETIDGDYLEMYEELFTPESQSRAIEELVGRTYSRTGLGPASNVAFRTTNGFSAVGSFPRTFIVPLRFYQTQDPNLAIPLVSLTRQELEIDITLEEIERLVVNTQTQSCGENIVGNLKTNAQFGGTPIKLTNATLLIDYVFLGEDEIQHFQKSSLDYLITQVQGIETCVSKDSDFSTFPKQIRTHFNNPVKEFFMIVQSNEYRPINAQDVDTTVTDYFRYKSSNLSKPDNLKSLELLFNGQPRLLSSVADAFYLRAVQPLQAHTRVPKRFFYIYSYSIDPENYQPTGQVNYSRISNIIYNLYLNDSNNSDRNVRIYVKNYNVLRVQSGVAGLLFNFNNSA